MEFFKALFDLIGDLAWPAVALVIAWRFGPELRTLIPRVRRAGPGGVDFDPADQPNPPDAGELKPLPGYTRTPAIEAVEKEIRQSVTQIPEAQRTDILARELAAARLSIFFERIYGGIYGTQIKGLRALNAPGRVTVQEARDFYDREAAPFADFYKSYGFDGWLGYLQKAALIQRSDDVLEITDLGRDFLLYLTTMRLQENKPF